MPTVSRKIIGARIDATSYQTATTLVLDWAHKHESRYVCAANVHMVMEAYDTQDFCEVVNQADLVTPDGMPLVWMLRLLGCKDQERVYGPDLMLWVAKNAAQKKIPVGFYGGSPDVLEALVYNLKARYSGLEVSFAYSPPFQSLKPEEDQKIVREIDASGARILFIGLGCPKQERWMMEHKDSLRVVMLGVGAAFDFHAGIKAQAPLWMQSWGLEWLFRLWVEPRRLWWRYFYHNPRFLILAFVQLIRLYTVGI